MTAAPWLLPALLAALLSVPVIARLAFHRHAWEMSPALLALIGWPVGALLSSIWLAIQGESIALAAAIGGLALLLGIGILAVAGREMFFLGLALQVPLERVVKVPDIRVTLTEVQGWGVDQAVGNTNAGDRVVLSVSEVGRRDLQTAMESGERVEIDVQSDRIISADGQLGRVLRWRDRAATVGLILASVILVAWSVATPFVAGLVLVRAF